MKHFNISFALLFSIIFSLCPMATRAYTVEGSLVKNASNPAVYYVASGKRYAFPSDKIFNNWYSDFSGVKVVSDAELASLPLSGNVTYRPGSMLIKITTDPRVYAVSRYGVLHWIASEEVANAIYGPKWNTKVADVPDTYFSNYMMGGQIDAANQFNPNEEQALAVNPSENIRPFNFTPLPLPAPVMPVKTPKLSVDLSTNQAVMNQTVYVFATVTNNPQPIEKIMIRAEDAPDVLATCEKSTTCSYQFQVQISPLTKRFYAEALDSKGSALTVPADSRPLLTVAASSDQVQMQVTPASVVVGSRANFTSNALNIQGIASHRVFAVIPGEKYPVLWQDCGASNTCSASSPFYRPTYLYSQVNFNGTTYQSAPVLVNVTGGAAPKPSIAVKSRPTPNQVEIAIDAPTGETIGLTSLVEGVTIDDKALALCEADCSVTLQISKPINLTAYSYVGGKYEASNTLQVAP